MFEGQNGPLSLMVLHDERWLTGAVPVYSDHSNGDVQGGTPQTGAAQVILVARVCLPPRVSNEVLTKLN